MNCEMCLARGPGMSANNTWTFLDIDGGFPAQRIRSRGGTCDRPGCRQCATAGPDVVRPGSCDGTCSLRAGRGPDPPADTARGEPAGTSTGLRSRGHSPTQGLHPPHQRRPRGCLTEVRMLVAQPGGKLVDNLFGGIGL